MKAVACLVGLCLLAGLVSAEYGWETGKQYRYKVRGRVMAGIAELDHQYSGMQLEYTQIITPESSNLINVKTEDLKVVEVNQELEQGWRESELKSGQVDSIPQELKQYLTSPMDMTLHKGVVQSIKVQGNLPTWAVNIKKAMASVWTLDTTGSNVLIQGNLHRHTNAVNPQEANQESGFFFETVEETVHGECKTYYTVNQNGPFDAPFPFQKSAQAGQGSSSSSSSESGEKQGKFQSQNRGYKAYRQFADASSSSSSSESSEESSSEKVWPRAFNQLCDQNDQIYEIIKTVNFTACVQKPVLGYTSPAQIQFHAGDNAGGSVWQRALVSRYLACGQSRRNYTILKVTQQERFYTGLQDLEKIVAGAQKNVTLISIGNGHAVHIKNPRTINNLAYTFSQKEQELRKTGALKSAMQSSSESNESQSRRGGQRGLFSSQENRAQSQSGSSSQEKYQNLRATRSPLTRQSPRQFRGQQSQSQEQQYGSQERRYGSQEQQYGSQERKYGSQEQQYGSQERKYRSHKQQYGSQEQQSGSQEQYQSGQRKGQLPQPSLTKAPLSSMLITPLKRDAMKQRVSELMQQIVRDLTKPTEKDSIAQREVLSKISTVVKVLRVLNAPAIQELAHKFTVHGNQEQEVARSIFLDALAIAGTNPTIVYLLEQIKTGKLNGEEAAQTLSTLPMYIRTPTKALLEKYFSLIQTEAVKGHIQVRTTAMLSFSTLVYNACINKHVKNSRYPVALYGEFCSEQYVSRKFVPYFIGRLEKRIQSQSQGQEQQEKHWVITLLATLGNLGHPDTIEVVQKILDRETDPLIKVKAIFALKNLVQSRSKLNQKSNQKIHPVDRQSRDILTDEVIEKQVLPVLVSVAFDRGEHPEVRQAALSLLFYCTYADVALWQQVAMSTWFEQNRSVRSFIVSSLKSFANLERPIRGFAWAQQYKARAVLPLCKNIDASVLRSHNIHTAKFVEDMNTGFAQHFQFFESHDSIVPNYMYYKNTFNFGNNAATVSPLEVSIGGNTIQKLATAFVNAVTKGQSGQEMKGHEDLSQIRHLLNIESRQQKTPVIGSLYINLKNEIQRLWTFDQQSVEKLAQQLVQGARQGANGHKMNVNYQKVVHMAETMHSMPTIMGIPLVFEMRMPAIVSLRGTIKLENQRGSSYAIQADLAPVYAWKIHKQLAFKCPLTGKKYQAGVQRHFVVEAPFSAVARKASRGQLELAITPRHLTKGAPTGTIDLVTYHQIPYTAIIHDEFWPTILPQGGKMQIVRANKGINGQEQEYKPYEATHTFGQKGLGLVFHVHQKSDFQQEKEQVSGWARFLSQFHTANCAFNAAWLGSPSVRFVERKIVLDIEQSQTKTLLIQVAAKTQRISIARKLQSSEEQSSSEEQTQRVSGSKSSSSSSSSSSSESAEGQSWFNYVRQAVLPTQRSQKLRQARTTVPSVSGRLGRQSRYQSGSKSQSQSQSQEQSGSQENSASQENSRSRELFDFSSSSESSSESQSQEQSQRRRGSQEQRRGSQSQSQSQEQSQRRRGSQEQGRQGRGQRGNVLAIALLGKKSPLACLNELRGQIQNQKPLQKGSQKSVQYLVQIAQNPLGKLFVRLSLGQACKQAVESLPQTQALNAIRQQIVQGSISQQQPQACVEFQGTLDTPKKASRHIVAIRRETLLQGDLSLKVQGKIQAGQTCHSMPLYVNIQGKLRRDQEMTEWARNKSPQAKKCIRDEQKGFTISQVCMDVAEQQAAALNEWTINLQHSEMPEQVKNYTLHAQSMLKALLYPYLSEDKFAHQTQAKQGSIQFWGRMTPNKQFVSLQIRRPHSVITFNNLKTNKLVKAILPFTATQTMYGNVKDRLLRVQSDPMCAIEKNYVNTFDNVTYSFRQETVKNCQHVLVKDCSGRYPMAVLVKDLQKNQGRVVTVLLEGQTKIQIIPSGAQIPHQQQQQQQPQTQQQQQQPGQYASLKNYFGYGNKNQQNKHNKQNRHQLQGSASGMTVLLNGRQVQLPHTIPAQRRNQQPVAEVMRMPNGGVQLVGRQIQVATDGQRVIVYVDNAFRNRTCGICGDFNNEKVAEMRSPKDFPLSSGTLLVASYAFKPLGASSSNQCQVDPQIKRQVRKEEQQGEQQSRYMSNYHKRGQNYQQQQQQRFQYQQQYRQQQQQQMKQQRQQSRQQRQQQGYSSSEYSSSSEEQTQRGSQSGSNSQESQEQGYLTKKAQNQQQQQQQRQQRSGRQSQSQEYKSQSQSGSQERQRYNTAPLTKKVQKSSRQQQQRGSGSQSQEFGSKSQSQSQSQEFGQLNSGVGQNIAYKQRVIKHPQHQGQVCFSINKVPVCQQGYQPKKMTQKSTKVYCMQQGQQAQQIQQQIQSGQFKNLSGKQTEQINVPYPQVCVRA